MATEHKLVVQSPYSRSWSGREHYARCDCGEWKMEITHSVPDALHQLHDAWRHHMSEVKKKEALEVSESNSGSEEPSREGEWQ